MSAIREHALTAYLPTKTVDRFPDPIDLSAIFQTPDVVIDFGCGMGDHTLNLAKESPGAHVLAMDVHTAGITNILISAHAAGIQNLSVFLGDGITILRDHLAPSSVSEVHVLFPDPWPKARQQKRRVIQSEFLEQVDRILKPKGIFRFVTDDDGYAEYATSKISNQDGWQILADDWKVPNTNYHQRAIRLGHSIHSISAMKN